MSQGGLVFYDPAAGTGQFYRITNGHTGSAVKTFTDWRTTWTQIVPGSFGGGGITDLLFYEGSTGTAEFWALGLDGSLRHFSTANLPANLTQIVAGNFSGSNFTDLLLYDAKAGTGQFFTVKQGVLHTLFNELGWRDSWKQIIPTPALPPGQTYYDPGIPASVWKEVG